MQELIICRCEEITLEEIEKAIEEGARTINEVKRRTRAGMGLCQGKTCSGLVSQIIARLTKQPLSQVLPGTFRPPVRPIKLAVLAASEE